MIDKVYSQITSIEDTRATNKDNITSSEKLRIMTAEFKLTSKRKLILDHDNEEMMQAAGDNICSHF